MFGILMVHGLARYLAGNGGRRRVRLYCGGLCALGVWLAAFPAAAQVGAGTAPNLNTLYGTRIATTRVQFDYTGADQVITAPANAIGVYFKVWGAGGGHEIVQNVAKAGAGGYTGAVFDTAAGTQYTLVVGGGGNRGARPDAGNPPAAPLQVGVYGFGGLGTHDQGGGLSGVFTGTAAVANTSRSRALAVAGGGGGSDDNAVSVRTGGTNGNGAQSGHGAVPGTLNWNYSGTSTTGRTAGPSISGTMQGSNDGYTVPANGAGCLDAQYPAVWASSGGGGYEGGGRTSYTFNSGGFASRCGSDTGGSGRGGSGFVAAANRFQSIESTVEIAAADNNAVNVAPRNGTDTDQSSTAGQPRTLVPIGRAGNRSNLVFSSNINGGGDGRIVVYWVVAEPRVGVQKTTTPGSGGPFSFTDTNLTGTVANITTTVAGTPTPSLATATANALVVTAPGTAVTLSETPAANFAPTGVTCTDNNSTLTGNTNPVATSSNGAVTIPAAATAARAADIVCVFSNTNAADLSLTKSNTYTASQPSDLPGDRLTRGSTPTYTLVVTNHGPAPVSGAVVRDTPGTSLTCPGTNTVTITGDGVPGGGPYTVASLTAGITLGTLAAGQSATLTFGCTVN